MQALVLCAGLGTRFRPATLTIPKPLLPVLGRPILFHLLAHLVAEGVDRFVLNTHHLPGVLKEAVGDAFEECPVAYSDEDSILGTAGAIRRARESDLLSPEPFLVVNGDLYTTLGLGRLLAARREPGIVSALAVVANPTPGSETPLWADARGRLTAVGGRPGDDATGPWLFTGIQAAHRQLVERIPEGFSELARDVLRPSAERRDGAIALVPYQLPEDGLWFDLGAPERLADAERRLATKTDRTTTS